MSICRSLLVTVLLACTLLPAFTAAEIYQWKDSSGNIVFGDSPPAGSSPQEKKLPEARIERPAPGTPDRNGTVRIDSSSLKSVTVVMYSTSWCPYCKKARAYITSLPGVRLVEYDIETSRIWKQEMLSKSGGSTGVPLVDVEGTIIRGYNPSAISAAVSRAQR